MRVDLLAPPFLGHLHPVLAMAREIGTEFDVRVVGTPSAQATIRASGAAAACVLTEAEEARLLAIANTRAAVRANPWRLRGQLQSAVALMRGLQRDLRVLYATDRPALLIADFTLAGVGPIAAELGIEWWTSMPSPCVVETPDGPPAYLGGLRPATHRGEALVLAGARALIRVAKHGLFRMHRKELAALGIERPYRANGDETVYSPRRVLALGLEELEFPRTWPRALRFVGPQLYTPPSVCAPPTFEAGRTHVLVTCGSHLPWFKGRLLDAARSLAEALPHAVVHYTAGDPASNLVRRRGNLVEYAYVDYQAHLRHYDVVVHHGGAGVMYACLAAAKAAVVFPVDYDQFDHAARLEAAGVAKRLRRLEMLAAVVAECIEDTIMRGDCVEMRDRLLAVRAERRVLGMVRDFGDSGRLRGLRGLAG